MDKNEEEIKRKKRGGNRQRKREEKRKERIGEKEKKRRERKEYEKNKKREKGSSWSGNQKQQSDKEEWESTGEIGEWLLFSFSSSSFLVFDFEGNVKFVLIKCFLKIWNSLW